MILITGASKGIGKALAIECARRGLDVVMLARSEEKLQKLSSQIVAEYSVAAPYLAIDLSRADAPAEALNWCNSNKFSIHGLINNAGYNIWGAFREKSIDAYTDMLDLNLYGVIRLTHALLPHLESNSPAYIMNVASTGAFQSTPWLSVYGAGKSFILSFSDALRYELKDSGISVSCLCPGPTESEMYKRTGTTVLKKRAKRVEMRAEQVAKIGLNGMLRRKSIIVPGFANKLGLFLNRFVSRGAATRIAARFLKP